MIGWQFYYRSDSKQKIETLSVFLLSLATQCVGGNGADRVSWKTMFLYHSRSAAIDIAPIAIAVKRCCRIDSYLKLSLSLRSAGQHSAGGNRPLRFVIMHVLGCLSTLRRVLRESGPARRTLLPEESEPAACLPLLLLQVPVRRPRDADRTQGNARAGAGLQM